MTRRRYRFLHRAGREYVFAAYTGPAGFGVPLWTLVRVPVDKFWRAT